MELYLKAGPCGATVGDCPFAHHVRCVIHYKGIDCKVFPCTADTKPSWLLQEMNGKMPCLKMDDHKITESKDIVDFLEKTFPTPSLSVSDPGDAVSLQSSMFIPMARLIKSSTFDEEKEDKLFQELKKLNDHFSSNKYLCGDQVSLFDYSLSPKLYHMDVTTNHFYPETRKRIQGSFPFLEKYMAQMFADSSFSATTYPSDTIIWGWNKARSS